MAKLNKTQLADWLQISPQRLDELLAAGLPFADNWADPAEVARWIEAQGLGRRVEQTGTVKTLADVARAFGVEPNTVRREWRGAGMPGRKGAWDLADIAAWKAARPQDPQQPTSGQPATVEADLAQLRRRRAAEARIKEAEAQRRERENRRAAGELLDRAEVERWAAAALVQFRELLLQLPEQIAALLPTEHRDQVLAEATRQVRDTLHTLHQHLTAPHGPGRP